MIKPATREALAWLLGILITVGGAVGTAFLTFETKADAHDAKLDSSRLERKVDAILLYIGLKPQDFTNEKEK